MSGSRVPAAAMEQSSSSSRWSHLSHINQPLAVGLIIGLFMASFTYWKVTPVWMLLEPTVSTVLPQPCPSWFGRMEDDMVPWRTHGGIEREVLESASASAYFRVVVVGGAVYVEQYKDAFNYRFNFTIWGLLMLIRRHPGLVPNVELLFCVDDLDAIGAGPKADGSPPGVLMQYSRDSAHVAILWPDWSFWGWPEVEIPEWGSKCTQIGEGGERAGPWASRVARAFWKGNPRTGRHHNKNLRKSIIACSQSGNSTGAVEAYGVNWAKERAKSGGLSHTRLEDQCQHRYRIYAEGNSWSVSLKYGLCCGSAMLLIQPYFQDFYSRGLVAWRHYIPVARDGLCERLTEAVEWGNAHPHKAEAIARAGQEFAQKDLDMDNVYDYLLHMLERYRDLLRFKPQVTQTMFKVTEDTFLVGVPVQVASYYRLVTERLAPPCRMRNAATHQ